MDEAIMWYQMAADLGYPKAQYALGLMHIAGQGVPKDERAGMEYMYAAAQSGYSEAEYISGKGK